jgi:hypothetical protein
MIDCCVWRRCRLFIKKCPGAYTSERVLEGCSTNDEVTRIMAHRISFYSPKRFNVNERTTVAGGLCSGGGLYSSVLKKVNVD